MMKNQSFPFLFGVLIIVIALAGGAIFYFQNGAEPTPNGNGNQNGNDVESWPEYVNEEYDFSIKHPPGWKVAAFPDDQIAPKFNIYKPESTDKQPPFDHFAEVTHVSIYPEGIPTEGEFGITEDPNVPIQEQTGAQSREFVFRNGTPWANYLTFTQGPSSWGPSGFIWTKVKRDNLKATCLRNGQPVSQQECDPLFGDTVEHEGSVDMQDYQTQMDMLSTFRFLEHGSGDVSDKINLFSPKPGDTVNSPLTVAGEARGTWYFEATFPIVITDWDGRIIGEGYAEAQDEWMTEDFVPFLAEVEFTPPENAPNKNGTLIIQRANPSGLPENDAAVEIPITFE